jgi:hypothetical protein
VSPSRSPPSPPPRLLSYSLFSSLLVSSSLWILPPLYTLRSHLPPFPYLTLEPTKHIHFLEIFSLRLH